MKARNNIVGFTLVELLIVLTLIAIIAAFAYPSYTNSVRQTLRKAAAGEVLALASAMERVKAQRFSYLSADGQAQTIEGYNISVQATANSYEIVARPTGDQIEDRCVQLIYDHNNVWQFLSMDDGDLGLGESDCID